MFAYASIITILAFVTFNSASHAQQSPQQLPPIAPNPSIGGNLVNFLSARTPYEFWLTCVIGLIGLLIIAALILSVSRVQHRRADDISRPVIVITVITGTLILVTAGYSNEQIAPAFGLFGTIVGYMLGRMSEQKAGSATGNPPSPSDTQEASVK
jgi:hypothetical protein